MSLSKPDKIASSVIEKTGVHCEFVNGNFALKYNGRTMYIGALPNEGQAAELSEVVAYAECLKKNAPPAKNEV